MGGASGPVGVASGQVGGAYLSLQPADDGLDSLQLLVFLQQRLLQLLHAQLSVVTELLLQAELGGGLRGHLQRLAQLKHTGGHTHTFSCTLTRQQSLYQPGPRLVKLQLQ